MLVGGSRAWVKRVAAIGVTGLAGFGTLQVLGGGEVGRSRGYGVSGEGLVWSAGVGVGGVGSDVGVFAGVEDERLETPMPISTLSKRSVILTALLSQPVDKVEAWARAFVGEDGLLGAEEVQKLLHWAVTNLARTSHPDSMHSHPLPTTSLTPPALSRRISAAGGRIPPEQVAAWVLDVRKEMAAEEFARFSDKTASSGSKRMSADAFALLVCGECGVGGGGGGGGGGDAFLLDEASFVTLRVTMAHHGSRLGGALDLCTGIPMGSGAHTSRAPKVTAKILQRAISAGTGFEFPLPLAAALLTAIEGPDAPTEGVDFHKARLLLTHPSITNPCPKPSNQ